MLDASHKFPYGVLTPIGTAHQLNKIASFSEYDNRKIGAPSKLLLLLHVISADRTTGDEVYDVYVTTKVGGFGDAKGEWDLVHFPQVATTGEKIYVASLQLNPGVGGPNQVTTAAPGVSSVESGTMLVTAAGAANGVKTLAAGTVRHGVFGEKLGHHLVVAGTTPILVYSLYALILPS